MAFEMRVLSLKSQRAQRRGTCNCWNAPQFGSRGGALKTECRSLDCSSGETMTLPPPSLRVLNCFNGRGERGCARQRPCRAAPARSGRWLCWQKQRSCARSSSYRAGQCRQSGRPEGQGGDGSCRVMVESMSLRCAPGHGMPLRLEMHRLSSAIRADGRR
jgi:hypothetical protein